MFYRSLRFTEDRTNQPEEIPISLNGRKWVKTGGRFKRFTGPRLKFLEGFLGCGIAETVRDDGRAWSLILA